MRTKQEKDGQKGRDDKMEVKALSPKTQKKKKTKPVSEVCCSSNNDNGADMKGGADAKGCVGELGKTAEMDQDAASEDMEMGRFAGVEAEQHNNNPEEKSDVDSGIGLSGEKDTGESDVNSDEPVNMTIGHNSDLSRSKTFDKSIAAASENCMSECNNSISCENNSASGSVGITARCVSESSASKSNFECIIDQVAKGEIIVSTPPRKPPKKRITELAKQMESSIECDNAVKNLIPLLEDSISEMDQDSLDLSKRTKRTPKKRKFHDEVNETAKTKQKPAKKSVSSKPKDEKCPKAKSDKSLKSKDDKSKLKDMKNCEAELSKTNEDGLEKSKCESSLDTKGDDAQNINVTDSNIKTEPQDKSSPKSKNVSKIKSKKSKAVSDALEKKVDNCLTVSSEGSVMASVKSVSVNIEKTKLGVPENGDTQVPSVAKETSLDSEVKKVKKPRPKVAKKVKNTEAAVDEVEKDVKDGDTLVKEKKPKSAKKRKLKENCENSTTIGDSELKSESSPPKQKKKNSKTVQGKEKDSGKKGKDSGENLKDSEGNAKDSNVTVKDSAGKPKDNEEKLKDSEEGKPKDSEVGKPKSSDEKLKDSSEGKPKDSSDEKPNDSEGKPKAKKKKSPKKDTKSIPNGDISEPMVVSDHGSDEPNSESAAQNSLANESVSCDGEDKTATKTDDSGENEDKSPSAKSEKSKKSFEAIECHICGRKAKGMSAFSRHLRTAHDISNRPAKHKCFMCDFDAVKRTVLAKHMVTHNIFMCGRCEFTSDKSDELEQHCSDEHKNVSEVKLCKNCNRYIKCDEVSLDEHVKNCQGKVPLICKECNKEFKYESSLRVHVNSHFPNQPKQYTCPHCSYQSNYKANLHKHIQNIHEIRERNVKCLLCDKMFYKDEHMRRHMKLHSEQRPFMCETCCKSFKTSSALRGHYEVHNTTRPFQCDLDGCAKTFRNAKFLKSHKEESHQLSPKKYHCPVDGCSFSFFKKSHLKRHEITHTGNQTG